MEDKTKHNPDHCVGCSLIISELKRDLNRLQKIISDATRSKCCGAKMIVSGGNDGTRWHECTKCGGACDGYITVAAMPNEKS